MNTLKNIKRLEGWFTVTEVADDLGITRTRVHQIIENGGIAMRDLRIVGPNIVLIRKLALARMHDERFSVRGT